MEELWKDVPGYDGVYQFSNMGRMRTTDHYDAANRFFKGKIMKPHVTKSNISYQLYKNNIKKDWNVKKLNCLLFPQECDSIEEWRPVVGFEKYYEVSESGKIRSLEYDEIVNGIHVHRYPKELKQYLNQDGYYMTKLRDNKRHSIHRLVAEAFIGTTDSSLEVDHIDGNRTNNHYTNLRFVTHRENIQHTIELGNRLVGNTRSKNYNAKPVKLIDEYGSEHCFDCMMDACGYIKNNHNIPTSIEGMLGSLRSAYRKDRPYFGYRLEYL